MVKLLYKGVMNGNMEGIGSIEVGKIYDVPDYIAKKVILNGEWKEVESKPFISEKVDKKKKKGFEEDE